MASSFRFLFFLQDYRNAFEMSLVGCVWKSPIKDCVHGKSESFEVLAMELILNQGVQSVWEN